MNIFEQTNLCLYEENKAKISVVCKLYKDEEKIIKSRVMIDEYTKKAQENFDYDFDGVSSFVPYKFAEQIKELDFQILVITGASGSGKSTFSKHFGEDENIYWNNNKSIISNFDNITPDEAVERLCAVGLNSIKTWCKPRNVLSVGEGFRADLARKIKSNCVIDEFTSTIDRNVAASCSCSIAKYIRAKNLKKCVFVSCHKDFIDYLCPDYVIDLDDEVIYDTRSLPRKKIELSIFKRNDKLQVWNIFKQHHYLSAELNTACDMYVCYWNDTLVGMIAVLPQPGVGNFYAYRVHRLVILPDFQGLGIAKAFLDEIADLYKKHNRTLFIRTSHIKLIRSLQKSKKWKTDGKMKVSTPNSFASKESREKILSLKRKSASCKYIADCENKDNKNYNIICFNQQQYIQKDFEKTSLFDFM